MTTEDVRYIKIINEPSWRPGDVVEIQVPMPQVQNEGSNQSDPDARSITVADAPPSQLRRIFVEVPDSSNEFFYIKYQEDSLITQYTQDDGENVPLRSPIIVPQCSIVKQTHLGFCHWHLIYECLIPLAVYISSILLLLYCIPRPQDTMMTIAVSGVPVVVVGMAMIYWRYQKSVMVGEMAWHLILGTLGMWVIMYVNTYFGIALRFLLQCLLPDGWREAIGKFDFVSQIAPFTEEIYKYLIFRFIANRGVVLDVQGLLAYAMIAGMMFGVFENVVFFRRAENGYALGETPPVVEGMEQAQMNPFEWLEFSYYSRIGGLIFHTYAAALSAARFAQRRFLGKDWGMWRCIGWSILMHALNNGLGMMVLGLVIILVMMAMDMHAMLSYGAIVASLLLVAVGLVIFRVNIVKTQCIPTVDIHALVASGQIKPRGISTILSDMCCLCSRKRKGLFTKQRKDRRSVIYSNDLN